MDRHVFLALPLPMAVKESLFRISESLKASVPMKKWVHPQDYHLTLVFLGKADDQALHNLSELLAKSVVCDPFVLKIQSLGSFGRPLQPRILWAGVEKNIALENLQSQIAALCGLAGFQLEARPFSPHITLSRSYHPEAEPLSLSVNELWPETEQVISATADQFVLFETLVDREPKYKVLQTYPLNKTLGD